MTSRLYQTPLDTFSLRVFRNPENQPAVNAQNCMAASSHMLGLITMAEARAEAARPAGVKMDIFLTFLNKKHETIEYKEEKLPVTKENLTFLADNMFNGFAAILGITRADNNGHFVILFKDKDGSLSIVDAQQLARYNGIDDIFTFVETYRLTNEFYYITGDPKTKEAYVDLFSDDILPDLLAKCMLGGKRSRKNGKKTKKSRKHHGVRTRRRGHRVR